MKGCIEGILGVKPRHPKPETDNLLFWDLVPRVQESDLLCPKVDLALQ